MLASAASCRHQQNLRADRNVEVRLGKLRDAGHRDGRRGRSDGRRQRGGQALHRLLDCGQRGRDVRRGHLRGGRPAARQANGRTRRRRGRGAALLAAQHRPGRVAGPLAPVTEQKDLRPDRDEEVR